MRRASITSISITSICFFSASYWVCGRGLMGYAVPPCHPVPPMPLSHPDHSHMLITQDRGGCWASGKDTTCSGVEELGARVWQPLAWLSSPQPALTCSSFISFSARSRSAVSASSSWEADSPVLRSSVSSDVSSEIWSGGEGVATSRNAGLTQLERWWRRALWGDGPPCGVLGVTHPGLQLVTTESQLIPLLLHLLKLAPQLLDLLLGPVRRAKRARGAVRGWAWELHPRVSEAGEAQARTQGTESHYL